jgi:hypothetical protein
MSVSDISRTKDDMEKDARYQFRLPRTLLDEALEKARREDVTLAQVLRRCVREWLKDPPDEFKEED